MDVDVFITNYIYVDPEIFSCWLEGLTRFDETSKRQSFNLFTFFFAIF